MVQLTKCCCCSLETGNIVLGSLDILFCIYIILGNLSSSINYPEYYAISMVYVFYGLTWLIFTVMLIDGVNNKKKDSMLPYIILKSVSLIIFCIFCAICLSDVNNYHKMHLFSSHGNLNNFIERQITTRVYLFLIMVLILTVGIYFTLVPWSYYKQLESEQRQPAVSYTNVQPYNPHVNLQVANDQPPSYHQCNP